jgi:hypothetical protein
MYTGTVREILDDVVHKDAPPLHVLRPDVPVVLSKIIGKLVQKDPSVSLEMHSRGSSVLTMSYRNVIQAPVA